jgi:hypothetical protein
MKGRETADDTMISTQPTLMLAVVPHQLSCLMHTRGFKILGSEISFDYIFLYFFLTTFGQNT